MPLRVLLLPVLLSAAPVPVSAELTSWEIKVSSPGVLSGDFVFAGVLRVEGAEMRPEGLFMPGEEFGGRIYRDVKLLSKSAYLAVTGAFKAGPGRGKDKAAGGKVSWKITAVRRVNGKSRKANIDIDFDGDLLATAGLVLSNRAGEKYWIAWPRYFVFRDKDLKKRIEKAIIERAAKEGL